MPVLILTGYHRFVSAFLPPACRFYPTCSVYMADAIVGHGAMRGFLLGLRRILRCHPYAPGGYDPVPAPAVGGVPHAARLQRPSACADARPLGLARPATCRADGPRNQETLGRRPLRRRVGGDNHGSDASRCSSVRATRWT